MTLQTAPADIHRNMTFSATKRLPSASVVDQRSSPRQRRTRLWLGLAGATIVLIIWVAWRLGEAGEIVYRLPGIVIEALNLLTLSAVATIGALWFIAAYQSWKARRSQTGLVVNVADLYALSPAQFEQFAAELFRARGYEVTVRGRSGDLGVDLEIANGNGKRAIAQCKRYRGTVGPDVVRELYGTMFHERVAHAFLVTTADISDGARQWAAGKPLTLIDGPTLVELANSAQLVLDA